ncbi:hypothetical protein D3C78_1691010 [compost metagenome]
MVTANSSVSVPEMPMTTGLPVTRPMSSTAGTVKPTVETKAPRHRLMARCISLFIAARTAVSDSGVKTMMAMRTPPTAAGAPATAMP